MARTSAVNVPFLKRVPC